jgi:NAD(P)H-dependent FMN reductase
LLNFLILILILNWHSKIESSQAVIFCTPEYVFSLPGALKNSIEWTVGTTLFSNKPVAVIVASGLGEKTFESLLLIMKTIEAKIDGSGQLLISGARSIINEEGEINDQKVLNNLDALISGLLKNISQKATV